MADETVWYKNPDEIPYNHLNPEMPENVLWTPKMRWICNGSDYPHYSNEILIIENSPYVPVSRWTFSESTDAYPRFTKHRELVSYEEQNSETD